MAKKKKISGGFGKFNMDDKSFGEAFNKFKAEGINPFPYKGKMYSTTTRDEVETGRKAKNIGASSDYSKASSSYQDAPKPPKVKKNISMPSTKSTRSDTSKSDKVKGTTNVKTEKKKKGGNPLFMKKGGVVKTKMKRTNKASKRADGIARKGKTKGRMI